LLHEIIAMDVNARGGKGRALTRRMLYLPALIVSAVLLACAVAQLALSEKAEATFPGKNGRIAYSSYDGSFPKGDFEIYTINPDVSGKTRLTNNDTDEFDLSFSPDGKRIAYECYGGTFRIVDTDICTISLRTDDKLAKLVPEKPAGNTLHDVLHHMLHITNNDTDDFNPDYSPDGKRIAYEGLEGSLALDQDVEDASTNIYTIKVGGGGNLNLTKSPKNASIWNAWPRYSPDGKKIAYIGPDGKIYTIIQQCVRLRSLLG